MDACHEASASADAPAQQATGIAPAELRSILSDLSHELCRPLVSLRAGFDLLLNDAARPISADQRGHVQTMAGLCDDLLRLTRSYLDYAGLMQGTRPLWFGEFTISAITREIDRQFSATAAERGIRWECRREGADATIRTDAARCQQIFGNLVANALKYTPAGGQVRVVSAAEGDTWSVSVIDDGPGIPREELDRVFAPFYRLAREERSRVEGNGLGLAIARELVDQLGGVIRLESDPGQGTRARVRLPVRPECDPSGRG
ncbi:MAG: HAMP domain-containing sensor histidine kinase [Isosphaeraceae bacterium]